MSLQKAINAKCRDCNYDQLDTGNWRQQIESCTSEDCALWPYRPVTGATKAARKAEKIAAMTPEEKAVYERKAELARERLHGGRK